MFTLNTIDLASFLSGKNTTEEDLAVAAELRAAFSTIGFAYLKGWEALVPAELVNRVFRFNQAFFDLPQATKDSLAYVSSRANRGYLSLGREQASLSTDKDQIAGERVEANDQKETFEIGNDCTPEFPEHWPKEADLPGFKETMNEFHLHCHTLNLRMMALLAISLGLPADHFVPAIKGRSNNLRLLHYPPARRDGSSHRLGAHTDFGTVTLLWQDGTGGLQVTGPDGSWVNVTPQAGTFVVNVGDILQRWSNDVLKSTVHRAILPAPAPGEDAGNLTKTRLSVAYFCNPDPDAIIECLPGFGAPKYEPIMAGDYYTAALEGEIGV